jgi:hypothetical protein
MDFLRKSGNRQQAIGKRVGIEGLEGKRRLVEEWEIREK